MPPRDAVLAAVDHAEQHLSGPVDVGAMAGAAGYSLFHFCRLFAARTRMSPHTYLVRRRLAVAAVPLLTSSRRIVDIAVEVGFDSHEGFTRAFTRGFGVTPSRARSEGDVAATRLLPRLTCAHLRCLSRYGLHPHVADEAGPAVRVGGDGVIEVPVDLRWPSRSSSGVVAGTTPIHVPVDGLDRADLPLVLDWLLRVWAPAARVDLAFPSVFVDRDGCRMTFWVRPM